MSTYAELSSHFDNLTASRTPIDGRVVVDVNRTERLAGVFCFGAVPIIRRVERRNSQLSCTSADYSTMFTSKLQANNEVMGAQRKDNESSRHNILRNLDFRNTQSE